MSNIYFIRHGKSGAIKIGIAKDPHKRLISLQIGNPVKLFLLASAPCKSEKEAKGMEKRLHILLKKRRVRGEWFQGDLKLKEIFELIPNLERHWY